MHDGGFKCYDDRKRTTWDDLKKELDSVYNDIRLVNTMEVSDEAKAPMLAELKKQVNEIKEKMHDYIDTL